MKEDNSELCFMECMLKIVNSLILISIFGLLFGCTTVPVHMSLDENNYKINENENIQKFPYSVAVIMNKDFTNFTLKSVQKNMNMTYDFEFKLGKDMSLTIPQILGKKFEKITILNDQASAKNYDIVIVPSIKLSRINTRISTDIAQEPIYAIEVNLGIIANKNNIEVINKNIKEGGEFKTEIACWTCWGKDVLNQNKISDEYHLILDKVNGKLYKLVDEIVETK
jgi:hypothetical protein